MTERSHTNLYCPASTKSFHSGGTEGAEPKPSQEACLSETKSDQTSGNRRQMAPCWAISGLPFQDAP
jgi:hypothetical protein